jgi:hypothetical protein
VRRAGALLILWPATLTAAAEPQLGVILPRGGQRGTEVRVSLHGQRLDDAQDLVFHETGITARDLVVADPTRIEATLVIDAACPLGFHGLRVRTATGISALRTFSVGDLPEVTEAEPNNTFAQAQAISAGCTINGVADNEDVDYYALDTRAGDVISAEIEGFRLGEIFFDPFVALFNDAGFELATCDDAALLRQDAVISAAIPRDGRYLVQVRESAYRGNGSCRYRLHVGRFPRPTAIVPAGGPPGAALAARLLGEPAGGRDLSITMPKRDEPGGAGWLPPGTVAIPIGDERGDAPSPLLVRDSTLENVLESEPNGDLGSATAAPAPAALGGVIDPPGDHDWFRFTASAGQVLDLSVYARRLRSPLDPVLLLRARDGGLIAANDDDQGPDSAIRFNVPRDDVYLLQIHDQLGRGGPDFAYRIEVAPLEPRLSLHAPRDRHAVAVPRGGRAALLLTANRSEFGGPLRVTGAGLPPGVSMEVAPVHETISAVPVLFRCADDAPPGCALVDLRVQHADEAVGISGGFRQDVELILGQNNVVLWAHTIDRLAVAVIEPAPFAIEVEPPAAPLVRDGSSALRVTVTRRGGYEGEIRLSVPFTPPGVGAAGSVVIAAGASEAAIPIDAAGNAALGTWSLLVAGDGPAPGGGSVSVASALVPLEVASPFLAFAPEPVTVEQGQEGQLYIAVKTLSPFDGPVALELHGLPPKVSAAAIEMAAGAESVSFAIRTEPDAPPGRHRNLFCIARVMHRGAAVIHRLPASELRLERPLPPQIAAAPPPPPPPPPPAGAPVPRPPTRLEKARLDHTARRGPPPQDAPP